MQHYLCYWAKGNLTFTVMPLWRSTSSLSKYWAFDPAAMAPVISMSLSANVLFP